MRFSSWSWEENGLRFTEWAETIKTPPPAVARQRCVCVFLAWQWKDADTPLTPGLACGGSLFYSSRVDWRVTECVCGGGDEPPDGGLSHLDHRVHRWSTATRSFQYREKKRPPLLKPSIDGLGGRCVSRWEIHLCLHWRRVLIDIMVAISHCY